MNKLSKYFFIAIALILLCIVGYRYYDYVYKGNFPLEVNAVCNPSIEKCFVSDCDPANDENCDTAPYKKVEISKNEAPICLEEHSCKTFSCSGLSNCAITYCSSDTLSDGEKCVE